MKKTTMSKLGSLALAACFAFAQLPAFAADGDSVQVIFEDVSETDLTTISGEAKIKVTFKGAEGNLSMVNAAFTFDGDLNYIKTDFMKGSNDLSKGDVQLATAEKGKLTAGLISSNPIAVEDEVEMFVITFGGDAGDSIELTLNEANSYVELDGKKIPLSASEKGNATAIESTNEAISASVQLTMDKVPNFDAANKDGAVTLTITNERTGSNIKNVLSDEYRGNGTVASYTIKNNVLKGDTYSVELSGIGYIPYSASGVTFDKALELTNADFVPGDVNHDGKIDDEDKTKFKEIMAGEDYSIAADFNRDGYVDEDDAAILGIEEESDDNDDDNKDDNSGSSSGSGSGSGSGSSGGSGSGGGSGSSGGSSSGGGSGSSGGSSSKGNGGGSSLVIPSTGTNSNETFTDLENHAWAKEYIYKLKNKGISNGISDTEFAPANNIKRGDFMLILSKMLNINDSLTENFADVPEGSYYYNAIGSAKAAGIASGSGDYFMPEDSITRQDLISLAYRAFFAKGYISEAEDLSALDQFGDKDSVSEYAKSAMASMVKAGIIQGSDGNVNPLGFATRAEVAVMCSRLLDLIG